MIVKSGVSKKLDLLVTSDPHSMSGKSKKARELGVRIVSLESFIGELGIEVD
jgi:NAD-dependent DNA ligase